MSQKVALIFILLISFIGYSQEKTVVGKNIKSIEFEVAGHVPEAPMADNLFQIQLTTLLADGQRIISDRTQNKYDYIVVVEGATTMRSERLLNEGSIVSLWFCKSYVPGADNTIEIKVKRAEDATWLATKKFPIYPVDRDNNPAENHQAKELIFTDAQVEEYQSEMRKLSKGQILQYASSFHKFGDNEEAKKIVGIGLLGRDPQEHDEIKKALDRSDQQQVYLDAQYWREAEEVIPIASLDNVYCFKESDTLDFSTGPSKNVAILKEGNTFIQVKTYSTDTPDEHGFVGNYGFEVNAFDISEGSFNKKLTKRFEKKFPEVSGVSFNQFRSCPKGYILVNPDMYIVFDKEFNIIFEKANTSKVKEDMYMDVDQLGTTDIFVAFYGDPSHSINGNNYLVSVEIVDIKTNITYNKFGDYVSQTVEQIIKSNDCIQTPANARIFSLSNNEFVTVYYENETTRVKKFKFENGTRTEIWHIHLPFIHWDVKPLEGNEFMFYGDKVGKARHSDAEIKTFTIDFSSNVALDARKSMIEISTPSNVIKSNSSQYIYPQDDGSTVVIGNSDYSSEFGYTPLVRVYNVDFSLQGQYRVGMPPAAEVADYGFFIKEDGSIGSHGDRGLLSGINEDPSFKKPIHQFSGRKWRTDYLYGNYIFETLQSQGITGMNFKDCKDVTTNAVTFFEEHTAFEYIRDGDILYMMSPFAIIKLDLNHVVEAKPYQGQTKVYTTSRDVFSRKWYEK